MFLKQDVFPLAVFCVELRVARLHIFCSSWIHSMEALNLNPV